jgi:hypothetical protein
MTVTGELDSKVQLGGYHLHRKLASDRVATYYAATDAAGGEVLIRVLHAHLADEPRHVAQFYAEGREGLEPSAAVRVFEVATWQEHHFWVVDLAAGSALIRPVEQPGYRPLERWLPVKSA